MSVPAAYQAAAFAEPREHGSAVVPREMRPPTIVVAGTASGVGKTSVATGLMAALRAKGLRVQAFKVGPDFLDPMYHELATGAPSHNLDGWMMGREGVLRVFQHATSDADVAVVEGVMGLFDGLDGLSEAGSTAEVAKWLGAPVLLVLDCSAAARSVAALVKGFCEFDPGVAVQALVFNRVGGAAHARWLSDALAAAGQDSVSILGGLPVTPAAALPERHLGLETPLEDPSAALAAIDALRAMILSHIDLNSLLELAGKGHDTNDNVVSAPAVVGASVHTGTPPRGLPPRPSPFGSQPPPDGSSSSGSSPAREGRNDGDDEDLARRGSCESSAAGATAMLDRSQSSDSLGPLPYHHPGVVACQRLSTPQRPPVQPSGVRIAVARDEAFCFYYQENLTLLEAAGAELVHFSPLRDALPGGISGVYIGGGYPELHASALSKNTALRAGLRAFSAAGGPIYAECGGLILLSRSVRPQPEAPECPMVGVFGFKTVLTPRATMGYVRVETTDDSPLFLPGRVARGQVFHYTEIVEERVVRAVGEGGVVGDGSGDEQGRVSDDSCTHPSLWRSSYRAWPQTPTRGPGSIAEGFTVDRTVASYIHLHFASCPELAYDFVQTCRLADGATLHAASLGAARAAISRDLDKAPAPSPSLSPFKGGDAMAAGLIHHVASSRRTSVSSADVKFSEEEPASTLNVSQRRHQSVPAELSSTTDSNDNAVFNLEKLDSVSEQAVPFSNGIRSQVTSEACLISSSTPLASSSATTPVVTPRRGTSVESAQALAGSGGMDLPAGGRHQGMDDAVPNNYHHTKVVGFSTTSAATQQQQRTLRSNDDDEVAAVPSANMREQKKLLPYSKSSDHIPRLASVHKALQQHGGLMTPAIVHRSPSCSQVTSLALSDPPPLLAWQANDRIVSLGAGATEILWALGLSPRVVGVSDACDWPQAATGRPRVAHHLLWLSSNQTGNSSGPTTTSGPGLLRRISSSATMMGGHSGKLSQLPASGTSSHQQQHGRTPSGSPLQAPGASHSVHPVVAFFSRLVGTAESAAKKQLTFGDLSRGFAKERLLGTSMTTSRSGAVGGGSSVVARSSSTTTTTTPPLALYVDERVLARERPSLIVAEDVGDAAEAVCDALVAVGLQAATRVVMMRRRHLSDVMEGILEVAAAAGAPRTGAELVEGLRTRLRRAAALAVKRPQSPTLIGSSLPQQRKSVLVVGSMKPAIVPIAAAPWIPEMVALAGGQWCLDTDEVGQEGGSSSVGWRIASTRDSVLLRGGPAFLVVGGGDNALHHSSVAATGSLHDADDGQVTSNASGRQTPKATRNTSPLLSPARLSAIGPDLLIVLYGPIDPGAPASRDGGLHAALTALCDAAAGNAFWQLPAVRSSNVVLAPAALFVRPGPRLVDGVELLARALHPADDVALPRCDNTSPPVLKLALRPGQRCRPALLSNYFAPW